MDNKINSSFGDWKTLFEAFADCLTPADIISAELLTSISVRITSIRLKMNMSQTEFAKYLGVSQGLVSRWESENYNFSIKLLAQICAKLNQHIRLDIYDASPEDQNKFPKYTNFSYSGVNVQNVTVSSELINHAFSKGYISTNFIEKVM